MTRTQPTGLQVTFLLFSLHFGGMLLARPVAEALKVPPEHFNTVGNLIVFPLELLLIFGLPSTRELVLQVLSRTPRTVERFEAVGVTLLKLVLTLGVWGAMYAGLGKSIEFDKADAWYFSGWGAVMAIVAVSFGPLCEEIVFRGALYRLWERQWGWISAMVLSAVAFAAVHPKNMLLTFLSGVLYICLLRRTGSLWVPFICHAAYNLLVTWPILGRTMQELTFSNADGVAALPWVTTCLALGFSGFLFYVLLAARRPAATD